MRGEELVMVYSFDIGPIRPPSEAYSLLIRTTKNCPWNRCKFCHTYKGGKFQLRPVEEIKQDIRTARAIKDEIAELSWKSGYGGRLQEAAAIFFSCLHRLDKAGLDVIYVEPVPETGLGRAIMERLNKAASRKKVEYKNLK